MKRKVHITFTYVIYYNQLFYNFRNARGIHNNFYFIRVAPSSQKVWYPWLGPLYYLLLLYTPIILLDCNPTH